MYHDIMNTIYGLIGIVAWTSAIIGIFLMVSGGL